ncbi:MAG TPA: hypothetical protein VF916_00645 [Ktedonobacterales bacterium]
MTRLTRIVCDNPACTAQVEQFAGDFYHAHMGMDDTPPGWYRLSYHELPERLAAAEREYPHEPIYFCSVACVRNFNGTLKTPKQVS